MAGINPVVKIEADTKGIDIAIVGLKGRVKAMADTLSKMRMDADSKALEAKIAGVQGRLLGVAKQAASLTMAGDTKRLDAQIAREKASLRNLQQQMSSLQADADTKAAAAKIAGLELQESRLSERLKTMKGVLNIADANAKLASIRAQLEVLKSDALAVKLNADSKAFLAQIKVVKASIAQLREEAARIRLNVDPQGLMAADTALLGIEATVQALGKKDVPAADTALGAFTSSLASAGTRGAFGWKLLTGDVALFGGVFNKVLPVVLSSVKVWHVLSDAIIEIGAVWIPATLAVGAFAVAASDAAVEVQRRLQAMHTELDATGRSIPRLTSGMEALHRSVRPQVYQLFGDAMIVMKSRTGTFAQVAKQTGTVIDQLAARMVYAVTSGNKLGTSTTQLSGFWKTAITDVSKLGDSIGNLFGVFANLFKALPGFAAALLTIGDDFTKILEAASAAAVPVLKWILLLHGYILYTGLAVTVSLAFIGGLANLAKLFVTFAKDSVLAGVGAIKAFALALWAGIGAIIEYGAAVIALAGEEGVLVAALTVLQDVPIVVWFALAAAAVAGLIYVFRSGNSATKDFTDGLNKTIQAASLSQVVPTIIASQAEAAARLSAAQATLARTTEFVTGTIGTNGAAVQQLNPAYQRAQDAVNALIATNKDLSAQYQRVNSRVGGLARTYGGTTQALGALNLAGITTAQITDKNSEHWKQALIQVQATTDAFQAMGVQGGQLGNDLDVLGRTVTDQYQSVQKLNQAWGTFIGDVTGTQGAFDTVAQGFNTLSDHSGKLTFTLGKLKVKYADANVAIDSLTPAGIALNQAFGDQVTNVDKLFGSWRTAGLANNLFTQGVKDAIAPLTRYANGSQEATAQLVALAQEAGYQGPISMQALSKWLGNTHGATKRLKDITNQATVQEALLTGAMQSQGSFIADKLLGDINQAILSYSGVSKAVSAYGTAVARSGKDSDDARGKMTKAITAIVTAELAMGDNTNQMAAIVAKTFGISMPDAIGLVKRSLGDLAAKTLPGAQGAFLTFAEVGLGKTTSKAHDLWNEVVARLGPKLDDLGSLAGGPAKKKFIDWAENGLHLSKDKATELWKELVTLQNHIDSLHGKNVGVNFVGTGSGSIAFKESIPGVTTGPSSTGILGFHAAGGFISGGIPGKDSVLSMLMPGEVVVPTSMVREGAVDHLRGMLPGFASGGVAGSTGSAKFTGLTGPGGVLTAGQPYMGKVEAAFGQAVEAAFAKAVIAKFKRDMNSLGGDGPAIVRYARSFLGQIPYVFGGNSLSGGIDCSGFTQQIYGKFGIHAPRTSEAQYAWVTRSGPVPGALAFYVSPAGGAPPGHVAIVQNGNSVISQGGGMGPTIESLNFLPLMGTGVPKGGFPSIRGGPGNQAIGGGALQAIAMALLRQYGWANQWNSFNALENSEAGWRLTAKNPGSGAYGLAQFINGPSEYFQYGGNPSTGLGQLTAMMNYIASRYPSGPNEAWAFHQRNNYYGKGGQVPGMAAGGQVPGMAAGGQVAAWHSRIRAAQAREYKDYLGFRKAELASLHSARPGSYLSGHKATITSELGTLARRQSAEEAAYDAVFNKGATKAVMSRLNTRLKAVMTTTRDKGLSYSGPGGHPGWLHEMQRQLAALEKIATGPVPAGARTPPHGPKLTQAAFMAKLKSLQRAEYHDYLGLAHAFKAGLRHPAKGSWLYAHRGQLGKDMARLRTLQSAEEAGYDNLLHHGTSLPNLAKEMGRINAELGALKASELSHLPGGHPGWVKGLKNQLTALNKLLAVQPFNAPWTPGKLGPVHTVLPGVERFRNGGRVFDRGGVLAPGWNGPLYNGTGRPEHLTPAGTGGTITLEVVSGGGSDFDQFMLAMIRKYVRVRGGGSTQAAFGKR
jgi:hypothetical protein